MACLYFLYYLVWLSLIPFCRCSLHQVAGYLIRTFYTLRLQYKLNERNQLSPIASAALVRTKESATAQARPWMRKH